MTLRVRYKASIVEKSLKLNLKCKRGARLEERKNIQSGTERIALKANAGNTTLVVG